MKPPPSWNGSKGWHKKSSISWTGSPSRPCAVSPNEWTNTLGRPVLERMSSGHLTIVPLWTQYGRPIRWPFARMVLYSGSEEGAPVRGLTAGLKWCLAGRHPIAGLRVSAHQASKVVGGVDLGVLGWASW